MKIICIGRNYAEHAAELGNALPEKPLLFMKPATALLKDNRPFYHPEFSQDIHHEIELVLKICKNGKHIEPKFANKYYNEISVGIDFTARDLQAECKKNGHPWEIAKAFDYSAVIGTFMPIEEATNADGTIDFSLRKNGELAQQGNSSLMITDFDNMVSYISKFFTLQTGDLIYTGTPKGVAAVQIGDKLEGFIGDKSLFICEVK